MNKGKINEIALRLISEHNIWDVSDNESTARNAAIYVSGVIDMARAMIKAQEDGNQ